MTDQPVIPRYRVTAINLGNITLDKSAMTYMSGVGTKLDVPVWGAAVEGNGLKILVDTGISEPEKYVPFHPCWQEEDETLEAALAELGWVVNDIDIVINSHLHYDHSENNPLMPNARFYVSLREWEFAKNPISTQRWLYTHNWDQHPLSFMNYVLVDQDLYEVVPGIKTIETPGHSAGHQSILIQTDEGIVCVAGDAACFAENFWRPTPPGGLTSVEQGLASIEKMRRYADRIFMNHDPEIKKYQQGGYPRVPAVGEES
jgi:glyoxylase-like metal-dependent hydrolase (beta-lactamase superfamily II)